jgi:YidC/Oxa1 family membrane protein insertase
MLWISKFVIIPIFHFLEGFVGSYGLIIVMLVLFVKILLLPLSYKSYLGMAKMKLLKPELDLIKEKNGENMTQNQQDQMKLYQQAGVNPFSGCIPLLLQMPILFSMFYFFPVSIELRQKSFLWAEDLVYLRFNYQLTLHHSSLWKSCKFICAVNDSLNYNIYLAK